MAWNPGLYLNFADQRGRPFSDLISHIHADDPHLIYDLGCGPGNLTMMLKQRWPDADMQGVDSSPEMVQAAQARGVSATLGNIEQWTPPKGTDVIVSNAALQWVPDHIALMTQWAEQLDSGAWMAFQVPNTIQLPSHRAMREVAQLAQFDPYLADMPWSQGSPVEPLADYAGALISAGCEVDAWDTTYLHQLSGKDPVLEWMSGAALTQVESRLSDTLWEEYKDTLIPILADAYPMREDGTTFYPLTRRFIVAHVK